MTKPDISDTTGATLPHFHTLPGVSGYGQRIAPQRLP